MAASVPHGGRGGTAPRAPRLATLARLAFIDSRLQAQLTQVLFCAFMLRFLLSVFLLNDYDMSDDLAKTNF
ncbi:hypothetical protein E2C01_021680 [Portunus trituberculatus]|uniref:Uncharacterized protein n=1 Tax=Portunus trituberculatus TaxID=210409 RepID=A0A5B7E6S9_PORTR|nr:hypothetical protein [Portunus trituberculatus]